MNIIREIRGEKEEKAVPAIISEEKSALLDFSF